MLTTRVSMANVNDYNLHALINSYRASERCDIKIMMTVRNIQRFKTYILIIIAMSVRIITPPLRSLGAVLSCRSQLSCRTHDALMTHELRGRSQVTGASKHECGQLYVNH